MKKMLASRAVSLCAALLLCTLSAAAWDGPGFSMELPSDWTPNLQGEQGGYSWRSPNADLELLVNVMENDGDPVNPFDISEDEADELLAPSRAASAQELEVGFQAQGLVCEISEVSGASSKAEWNGQPVLRTDAAYSVYFPETDSEVPLYMRLCLLMSKEHVYGITYLTTEEAALEEADHLGVMESFTITEAVFDGPTSHAALWGDVIFRVGLTALCAAVAVSALIKLRSGKKHKADTAEHLPPQP